MEPRGGKTSLSQGSKAQNAGLEVPTIIFFRIWKRSQNEADSEEELTQRERKRECVCEREERERSETQSHVSLGSSYD